MTDRADVRRGYEDHAAAYAAKRSPSDRELAILDAFLGSVPARARVLDAGCGHGDPVLRRLREHVRGDGTAVGIDFSRAQLGFAADAVPAAALVAGDVTALPFREDAFDAVTAVDAIIHVPLPDHQTVVDEFARVLRAGGTLLLSEASEPFERETENWLGESAAMTWHMAGPEATREHLRSAGFRLVDEWPAPDPAEDGPPEPPFYEAVLAE